MINLFTIKSGIIGICLVFTSSVFAQKVKPEKHKFLEGKKFSVSFTEIKATGLSKPMPDMIIIKGGKVNSDLMEEKLKAPSMPYKVTLDTTYTEDEEDVYKVNFTAEYTEGKTSYKWDVSVTDYDIEGTIIMLKSGVEKKRFEFEGEEKTKK